MNRTEYYDAETGEELSYIVSRMNPAANIPAILASECARLERERDDALSRLAACERDAMSAPRLLRELGEARLAIRWLMSSNWAEPGTDYIISRAVDAALEVSHEP